MKMDEKVREIGFADFRDLKKYSEIVFRKIFVGREKAKQRVVYDLLSYMRTNNRTQFLNQVLKLIASQPNDSDSKKLSEIINTLWVEYDTPENFEKMGYTIIMGIMSSGSGGEKNG